MGTKSAKVATERLYRLGVEGNVILAYLPGDEVPAGAEVYPLDEAMRRREWRQYPAAAREQAARERAARATGDTADAAAHKALTAPKAPKPKSPKSKPSRPQDAPVAE